MVGPHQKASYPIIKLHLPLNKLQDNFNPTTSLAVLCSVGLQRLATGANLRHTWWRLWGDKKAMKPHVFVNDHPAGQ